MRTHIKVVGFVHMLFGVLGILGAIGIVFGGLFSGLFSGSLSTLLWMGTTGLVVGVVRGILSLFEIVAAFALLNHRQWARYVIIVVSVLSLFTFPWGTIFGAYSLWVLFHKETEAMFKGQASVF